jgi:hypothetical protein
VASVHDVAIAGGTWAATRAGAGLVRTLAVLLVVPVVIVLAVSIVPLLLFELLGLCLGRPPPLLSSTDGEPRRPQSRMSGTEAITLRDGRQLEFGVYGPEDGEPAVFVHGWGCCCTYFASPFCQAVFAAQGPPVGPARRDRMHQSPGSSGLESSG